MSNPLSKSGYEGLTNIYDKESTLLSDLADFNKKYVDYINCEQSSCSTLTEKQALMQIAHNKIINTDIVDVINAIPSNGLKPSQYDSSFNQLIQTHESVIKTRMDLDKKLNELNKTRDTYYSDTKKQLDSTMYINILLTVLATSVLYFTFTKL